MDFGKGLESPLMMLLKSEHELDEKLKSFEAAERPGKGRSVEQVRRIFCLRALLPYYLEDLYGRCMKL